MPHGLDQLCTEAIAGKPSPILAGLTAREAEILRLRAANHDVGGIARRLGVQEKTIMAHLKNARGKLGLQFARSSDIMVLFLRSEILRVDELHLPAPASQLLGAEADPWAGDRFGGWRMQGGG